VVLTVVHLFTLHPHTTGMSILESLMNIPIRKGLLK